MGAGSFSQLFLLAGLLICKSYGQGGVAEVVNLGKLADAVLLTATTESLTEVVWVAGSLTGSIVDDSQAVKASTPAVVDVTTASAVTVPPQTVEVTVLTTAAAPEPTPEPQAETTPTAVVTPIPEVVTTASTGDGVGVIVATTAAPAVIVVDTTQTTTIETVGAFAPGSASARDEVRRLMKLEGYQSDIIDQVLTSMPNLTPNQFKLAQTKVDEMRARSDPTTPAPTTPVPYQTPQAPYQRTHEPYQTSKAPYQRPYVPYQTSKAPYQRPYEPYQTSKAPYQAPRAPYQPPSYFNNQYKNPYVYPNYNPYPQINYQQQAINKYGVPRSMPTYPLGVNSAGSKPSSYPLEPPSWNNNPSKYPLGRSQNIISQIGTNTVVKQTNQVAPSAPVVPVVPVVPAVPAIPAIPAVPVPTTFQKNSIRQPQTGYPARFLQNPGSNMINPFSIRTPSSGTPPGVDPRVIRYLGGSAAPIVKLPTQSQPYQNSVQSRFPSVNFNMNNRYIPRRFLPPVNRYQNVRRQMQQPPRPKSHAAAGVVFLSALQGGEMAPSLLYAGLPPHIQRSPLATMMLANPDMISEMAESPGGQAMILRMFQ